MENTISKIKTFNGCRQKTAEESVYLKKDQWQLFSLNREGGKRKGKKPETSYVVQYQKSKPTCNRINQRPVIRSESDGTGLRNAGLTSGASLYWDIPMATGTKADTFVG